jgi:hypothetical protein
MSELQGDLGISWKPEGVKRTRAEELKNQNFEPKPGRLKLDSRLSRGRELP